MRPSLSKLRSSLLAFITLASVGLSRPAEAQQHYVIDQRYGDIEFTVDHLGLFSSSGAFQRFYGQLSVDFANPPDSGIEVEIDANSMAMPWEEALTMLRSVDYFDVRQYPHIVFHSTAVMPAGTNHYTIRGLLQIRGVTQPETLDATLVDRRPNPSGKTEVADFVVTGKLRRSAFGMTADRIFVSDSVDIRIRARIQLAEAGHAN